MIDEDTMRTPVLLLFAPVSQKGPPEVSSIIGPVSLDPLLKTCKSGTVIHYSQSPARKSTLVDGETIRRYVLSSVYRERKRE